MWLSQSSTLICLRILTMLLMRILQLRTAALAPSVDFHPGHRLTQDKDQRWPLLTALPLIPNLSLVAL